MVRNEYPRPQMEREAYICLNGEWQFSFDDRQESLQNKWYQPQVQLERTIQVPFCFESICSGIGETQPHETVFYKRNFELPRDWEEKQVILHFGAVDYRCRVYVNGKFAGGHTGGQTPFSFNITSLLQPGSNQVSVWVQDRMEDLSQPRGKQYWKPKSEGIFYTRTTGIWQTVWLEAVEEFHLTALRFTPDIERMQVQLDMEFACAPENARVEVIVSQEDEIFAQEQISLYEEKSYAVISFARKKSLFHYNNKLLWSPEHPVLFDAVIRLYSGERLCDEVKSYFGMRKVEQRDGNLYLNGQPYFLRLVLDQGYWPDGVMTAPLDEDFQKDIRLAKEMGFNGCRKHQKVEDPRFLYWADKMGFLVWGECGNTQEFSVQSVERQLAEWPEIIRRDYNHPCIIAWVPLNESWGVLNIASDRQQQEFSLALYYTIKSLDQTRPVVNNDGWEMTKTDIVAIHHYGHGTEEEQWKRQIFSRDLTDLSTMLHTLPAYRRLFADGYSYEGQPVMLTEFGGIRYAPGDSGNGWGYTNSSTPQELLEQLRQLFHMVTASPYLSGFCYTQLTDVEQEENGLLYADRTPKIEPELCRKLIHTWRPHQAMI